MSGFNPLISRCASAHVVTLRNNSPRANARSALARQLCLRGRFHTKLVRHRRQCIHAARGKEAHDAMMYTYTQSHAKRFPMGCVTQV